MLYRFHPSNGDFLEVHKGIDFVRRRQAEVFAQRLYRRTFGRGAPEIWRLSGGRVTVTDESDNLVFEITGSPGGRFIALPLAYR